MCFSNRTCTGHDLEESIYHTFIVPCDEAINCGYFQSIRAKARYLSQTQGCSDRTFEGSGYLFLERTFRKLN